MTIKDKVCIVGVGTTKYGLRGEFSHRSQVGMIGEALNNALQDSGLTLKDVDGFASFSGEHNDPSFVAPALGIPNVNYSGMTFGGGGGGTCAAVAEAAAAVLAGYAGVIMVYKVQLQPPSARYGSSYTRTADPWGDFLRPFGLLAPGQLFALLVRRHMHLYGTKPTHLAEVAVACRNHARRNPRALMRSPMTIEDHQNSRMIAEPFRLYDYCQENDGAAVILVTSAERARQCKQRPVYIMAAAEGGSAEWGRGQTAQNMPDELYATAGHRHVAKRLYAMAGIAPQDIDVAELYDHFSGMVLLQLEDYGFCKVGESGPFVEGGRIMGPDGELPVNTHGGNLSEVYLLGTTHVIEGVRQLRGASTCQVPDAEIALVTAGPTVVPTSALILRR